MELKLSLHVIETVLGYAEKDHGLLAIQQELAFSPEFASLYSKLKSVTGGAVVPVPDPEPIKGFSTRGNEILLDGAPFRFTGYNLREAAFYGEPLDETRWTDVAFLQHQLNVAKDLGGKVIRFYAAHRNYTAEQVIPRVIHVLDHLHARGLYAIVALTDGVGSGFSLPDTTQNFRDRHTHEFYGGGYRQNYLPYITKMLEAIKDHPALFMVEPGNEFLVPYPDFVPNPPTAKQFENIFNFFRETTTVMREIAPKPLRGTGFVSSWEVFVEQAYGGAQYAKSLFDLGMFDAACVHTYEGQRSHKWGDTGMHLEKEMALQGHPLYIGEMGMNVGTADGGWTARLGDQTAPRVSGVLQWALQAWPQDRGVGDNRVGMNQYHMTMWHHNTGNMRHLASNSYR